MTYYVAAGRGGTAGPFAPLSAELVYLPQPAPNHPCCAELAYPVLQSPNWAMKYDHHEAPCSKTWLKHCVFGFSAVMVAVSSKLWAAMEAGFCLAVRPQALSTFCAFTVDLFISHLHVSFVGASRCTTNNGKWLKVSEMFLSHRKQVENRKTFT